jgi:GNAT superfamily N-acetyltransferase
MIDETLRIEANPTREDMALLDDRLYEFNAAVTGIDDGRWLAIFVRDGAGEMVAGLRGWTWGTTGHVDTLWVREDLRHRGLGQRMLAAAEAEAVRRGCREMHLSTHSYQAPGFYPRAGYQALGELPGWPSGKGTRIFFRKSL